MVYKSYIYACKRYFSCTFICLYIDTFICIYVYIDIYIYLFMCLYKNQSTRVRRRGRTASSSTTATAGTASRSAAPLRLTPPTLTPDPSTRNPVHKLCIKRCIDGGHRVTVCCTPQPYRGTSPIRERTPLGHYRRPMPRVLGGS